MTADRQLEANRACQTNPTEGACLTGPVDGRTGTEGGNLPAWWGYASGSSAAGSENIAPGASGLGCVVFEVPQSAKITEVQFTLDSGMGPQTGQWNVG